MRNRGSEFASPSERYTGADARDFHPLGSYVCRAKLRYVPIVITHCERLAWVEKIANFGREPDFPSGKTGLRAYILPYGNRDNDVPVVVAVSTIRKR